MPTVRFTDNIQRHVECPTRVVEGAHVRDVLDAYFATNTWQTVSLNLPPIHSVRFERAG